MSANVTPAPWAWASRKARSLSRRSAMSWFSSCGAGAAVGDVRFSDMEGRPYSEAFKGVVSDQNP